jgi:hypothetical protein
VSALGAEYTWDDDLVLQLEGFATLVFDAPAGARLAFLEHPEADVSDDRAVVALWGFVASTTWTTFDRHLELSAFLLYLTSLEADLLSRLEASWSFDDHHAVGAGANLLYGRFGDETPAGAFADNSQVFVDYRLSF